MNSFNEALLKRNQSWKGNLSQGAQETMDWLGQFYPTNKPEDRAIKGYIWDGDTCNVSYLTSDELRETANHLIEAANWLDTQGVLLDQDHGEPDEF